MGRVSPQEAQARADLWRQLRGTRWKLQAFGSNPKGLVAHIHDDQNEVGVAFHLRNGGRWKDFLRAIRAAAQRTHEQVLEDEREQMRLLTGQAAPE